jgi:hypothetical protein
MARTSQSLTRVKGAYMWGMVRSVVGIVLIAGAAAGCANSDELKARFNGRWGPPPAIQATDVANVAQNQLLVLSYLEKSAGYMSADGVMLRQLAPADFAEIAQWGFNIGRQDCEIYMDNLFRLNREKGRNDNILAGLSTAAAAIITGTTTAQKPLSILAAVFGLSIALNDAIFQSYLFSQAPGLVSKKVSDMQEVFRNSIVTGKVTVNSPASVYYAVQSYYHICLPHSIEGVMLQSIADTTPTTPPGSGGNSPAGAAGTTPTAAIRTPELQ